MAAATRPCGLPLSTSACYSTGSRLTEPEIDYTGLFRSRPGMVALLPPERVIADANEESLGLAGRTREQVVGRYLPDAFPELPDDPVAAVRRNVQASLRRVAETGEPDTIALQRYDVEDPDRPGIRDERYWSWVNTPVFGSDGRVALLLHRVEEVTELIRAREVALSLQEAMLPAPRPAGHHRAAVRYRPAPRALHVGGDWYDLADLPGGRVAVAVGDVAGHGLPPAGVMGQLRSALSAASRAAGGPAPALDLLGLYARSVDGAAHRLQAPEPSTDAAARVLSPDGLIERRREDPDTGLARLARSLARHRADGPETLADALLADLLPPGGATDDTALVIMRL